MRGIVLVALAVIAAGCSSGDAHDVPLPTPAQRLAFLRATNIFLVDTDIDGTTAALGVDTGSPFVLVSPSVYEGRSDVADATLHIDGASYPGVQVITNSASPKSPDSAITLGGLIGCPLLCDTTATFNYRDGIFTLGAAPAVDGLLSDHAIPFDFEGGGTTVQVSSSSSVTVPRSRVVVDVAIEGTSYRMMLDSGASQVVVDADVFAALTADGRTTLTIGGVQTTAGESSASYTRVRSIRVGDAEVDAPVIGHDTSFDANIASLSTDAGETLHGSLGGTFLDHFLVSIDYPNRTLHLTPFADTSYVVDPAELVGIALGAPGSSGAAVQGVTAGSDAAAQGIHKGDVVVAIDGAPLANLSVSEASVLLAGTVGATKSVDLGNRTLDVKVEERLPLP